MNDLAEGGGRQSLSRKAKNKYDHIYLGENISLGCSSFHGYRHRATTS